MQRRSSSWVRLHQCRLLRRAVSELEHRWALLAEIPLLVDLVHHSVPLRSRVREVREQQVALIPKCTAMPESPPTSTIRQYNTGTARAGEAQQSKS